MVNRKPAIPNRQEFNPVTDHKRRRWQSLRPRRPMTVWGLLMWLLIALLLYLLITYIFLPWYRPLPTDIPPGPTVSLAWRIL
jgi:hypothetical protein